MQNFRPYIYNHTNFNRTWQIIKYNYFTKAVKHSCIDLVNEYFIWIFIWHLRKVSKENILTFYIKKLLRKEKRFEETL